MPVPNEESHLILPYHPPVQPYRNTGAHMTIRPKLEENLVTTRVRIRAIENYYPQVPALEPSRRWRVLRSRRSTLI